MPARVLSGLVADPALTLYDSSGRVIATNDNWELDPSTAEILADGLAPISAMEAATIQTLNPGAYTMIATSGGGASGIGLVEAYDLTPSSGSRLADTSTRGSVGTDDNVLIGRFIVGDVASNTLIVRALGRSLACANVVDPLSDPTLTIYDYNGSAIASNDNWQEDINSPYVQKNGLAPIDAAESAIALYLPAGAYSTIVAGADGGNGGWDWSKCSTLISAWLEKASAESVDDGARISGASDLISPLRCPRFDRGDCAARPMRAF